MKQKLILIPLFTFLTLAGCQQAPDYVWTLEASSNVSESTAVQKKAVPKKPEIEKESAEVPKQTEQPQSLDGEHPQAPPSRASQQKQPSPNQAGVPIDGLPMVPRQHSHQVFIQPPVAKPLFNCRPYCPPGNP